MAVCLLVMWRLSGHFADVTDLLQTTLVLHFAQEGAQLHEGHAPVSDVYTCPPRPWWQKTKQKTVGCVVGVDDEALFSSTCLHVARGCQKTHAI